MYEVLQARSGCGVAGDRRQARHDFESGRDLSGRPAETYHP
jgi:hypothetical protein